MTSFMKSIAYNFFLYAIACQDQKIFFEKVFFEREYFQRINSQIFARGKGDDEESRTSRQPSWTSSKYTSTFIKYAINSVRVV